MSTLNARVGWDHVNAKAVMHDNVLFGRQVVREGVDEGEMITFAPRSGTLSHFNGIDVELTGAVCLPFLPSFDC